MKDIYKIPECIYFVCVSYDLMYLHCHVRGDDKLINEYHYFKSDGVGLVDQSCMWSQHNGTAMMFIRAFLGGRKGWNSDSRTTFSRGERERERGGGGERERRRNKLVKDFT